MPARGSGAYAVSPRRIQRAAQRVVTPIKRVPATHVAPRTPAPSRHVAPPPKWVGPAPGSGSNPFVNQQKTAARVGRRAQLGVPAAQVPRIPTPRGPRGMPSRAQTQAVLQLAARANTSPLTRREIATDPRLAGYRRSLLPYQVAQALRAEKAEAGRVYTGSETIRNTKPARGLGPYSALAIAQQVPRARNVQARVQPKPKGHGLVSPHTLGTVVSTVAPGLAAATKEVHPSLSLGPLDAVTKDLKTLATVPFVGGLEMYRALAPAVAGKSLQPLEQYGKRTAHQLYTQGVTGKLLHGEVGKALQEYPKHPVIAPLETLPFLGIPGKVAGTLGRVAGASRLEGSVGRAFARVRSPIAIEPREASLAHRYLHQPTASSDVIRGLLQQYLDVRRPTIINRKGQPVKVTRGGKRVVVRAAKEGRTTLLGKKLPGIFNEAERLAGRRENYRSAAASAEIRRIREHSNVRQLRKVDPVKLKGRAERDLAQPAGEGILRTVATWDKDVAVEVNKLKYNIAHPDEVGLDELGLEAAKKRLAAFEKARKMQAPRRDAVIKAGEARAKLHIQIDKELEREGFAPASRLHSSRLSAGGLQHVPGARYGEVVDKEAIAEHAALKARHKAAQGEVTKAQADLEKAKVARGHAGGQQRRRARPQPTERMAAKGEGARGQLQRRPSTPAEHRAAEGGGDLINAADARIRGAQERLAEAVSNEQAAGGYPSTPRPRKALIDEKGRHIDAERIEREVFSAVGRDPNTVHYLPHRVDETLRRSYFRHLRPGGRPGVGAHAREGIMQARGEHAFGEALSADEITNKRVTLATIRHHDEAGREMGVKMPAYQDALDKKAHGEELTKGEQDLIDSKGRGTFKEVHDAAKDVERATGVGMVPWKMSGPRMSESAVQDLGHTLDSAPMESLQSGMLRSRMADDGSSARHYELIPARAANRMEAQAKPVGSGIKIGQLLNVPFRLAVLPQLRWLTGNFVEPYFVRLPLAGSGVINLPGMAVDIANGYRVLKHMERHADPRVKHAAQVLRAQYGEGLLIGGKQNVVRTRAEDFPDSHLGRALQLVEAGFHKNVAKQIGQLALALPKSFFWFNRHVIENPLQMASFGKSARREAQTFLHQWHKTVKLGDRAKEELAKGLTETPLQHQFLREQHILLGQYDAFGPGMRHSIQSFTPFLPWTLASMRFVYWTFPVHKTNAWTAMLKAGQAVLPEWEKMHSGAPPGELRWDPRTSRGGFTPIAKYTPFGISIPLAEEGPVPLADTFAPQAKGVWNALHGQDPFGRELELPGHRKPSVQDKELIALNQLLGGFVPGLSLVQRLEEGGGTGYSSSNVLSPQVKPGTTFQSAVNRTINPLRPVYLKTPGGSAPSAKQQAQEEAQYMHDLVQAERNGGTGATAQEEAEYMEELRKGGG